MKPRHDMVVELELHGDQQQPTPTSSYKTLKYELEGIDELGPGPLGPDARLHDITQLHQ